MQAPPTVSLSLHAMATRFELVLYGEDVLRLRAAGEEALQEIERLESQLSFYSVLSEIGRINARASEEPVKVEARLFDLLRDCVRLTHQTDGAFDISVGPLMRAWRFFGTEGREPSAVEVESVRSVVGIENVELDDDLLTIRFKRSGTELDLGGYAKGYAIDRAMALLKENGVTAALLHGGASSVSCIGAPPGAGAWNIGLHSLFNSGDGRSIVSLRDSVLSFSALHGKSFTKDGISYGHVLDPRTCKPVSGHLAAVVVGQGAALCEALSTALLVNGPTWLPVMTERFAGCGGMIAFEQAGSKVEVLSTLVRTATV
jgi:thiamine biosynthesis lipoprotein